MAKLVHVEPSSVDPWATGLVNLCSMILH